MQHIILVGFQGSGKNTVGEHLIKQYGYVGMSFADALKDAVAAIFCWDRVMLEGVTPDARAWRETVDPWWAAKLGIPNFTPRWMLRNFGTEIMRDHFSQDIWLHNVEKRILDLGPQAKVVIMDGRFRNEIDLIKNRFRGTTTRVRRGPEPDWFVHARMANYAESGFDRLIADDVCINLGIHRSERDWVGYPFDTIVENDSTVEDLHRRVDDWIAG